MIGFSVRRFIHYMPSPFEATTNERLYALPPDIAHDGRRCFSSIKEDACRYRRARSSFRIVTASIYFEQLIHCADERKSVSFPARLLAHLRRVGRQTRRRAGKPSRIRIIFAGGDRRATAKRGPPLVPRQLGSSPHREGSRLQPRHGKMLSSLPRDAAGLCSSRCRRSVVEIPNITSPSHRHHAGAAGVEVISALSILPRNMPPVAFMPQRSIL